MTVLYMMMMMMMMMTTTTTTTTMIVTIKVIVREKKVKHVLHYSGLVSRYYSQIWFLLRL